MDLILEVKKEIVLKFIEKIVSDNNLSYNDLKLCKKYINEGDDVVFTLHQNGQWSIDGKYKETVFTINAVVNHVKTNFNGKEFMENKINIEIWTSK
jgi:hypothetical protein